jgi:hypothetical protein
VLFVNLNAIESAVPFAEDVYNCVAVAINPVHLQVQKAVSILIDCLSHKGDLDKAELYAQMTLDSLKDPANKVPQMSELVACGYHNLGRVINHQNGDLVKAEMLIRESLRIRGHICGQYHPHIASGVTILGNIFCVYIYMYCKYTRSSKVSMLHIENDYVYYDFM